MTTLNVKGLRFSKLVGFDENNFTPKWRYGILYSKNHLYTFICNLRGDPDVCICLTSSGELVGIHGVYLELAR